MRASALTGAAARRHRPCRRPVRLRLGHQDRDASSLGASPPSSKATSSAKAGRRRSWSRPPTRSRGSQSDDRGLHRENNIQEIRVKIGDPGAPAINLPVPDGWEPAREHAPEYAYGAIVYTGPEAGSTRPTSSP